MLSIEVYVVGFIIILLTKVIHKWRNPKCKGLLPPGSSGFPLIGESLTLIIPSYSHDVHPFLRNRLQRHGPLFRTNVAGRNVVVSADQEFNHFIFQQEEKLVVHWYMDLFEKIFNQASELRPDGLTVHKYMRDLVLRRFGAECIKQKLLSHFHGIVQTTLRSWSIQDSIELESASTAIFGEIGAKELYSYDGESSKEFTDKFISISRAAMSFPLNIPGTTYYKCLKDKDKVMKTIKEMVKSRIEASHGNIIQEDDLLNDMIKDMNTEKFLTLEFITQLIFGLTFATFQTIPTILAFALKFISEDKDVLQELIAEHEEILKKRRDSDSSSVTWEEYKSMTFTLQVINETLRLGNTVPGFLRKAIKDIKVKGYTIPAGWGIMACHSVMHLDPNLYKDPLKFNPWRWKDVKAEFVSKNLTPFGGGMKQCAGADYVRASMTIFLHVLVTKYRWNVVKGGDIVQNPMMHLKNGLHINVYEK